MKIAGFLCALFGLVLFFIPVLGPVLALIGLILSIVALCKNKEKNNKGLSIAGIVISAIAIVLGVIFTFMVVFYGVMLLEINGSEIKSSVMSAVVQKEILEVQAEVNEVISANKEFLGDSITTKEIIKEIIFDGEETNIVYDRTLFELLPETKKSVFKDKVALADSGKTYYKINSDYVYNSAADLEIYVIDKDGKVYINTLLENAEI